jgi:hypothetical protein
MVFGKKNQLKVENSSFFKFSSEKAQDQARIKVIRNFFIEERFQS